MKTFIRFYLFALIILVGFYSCKVPSLSGKQENKAVPSVFINSKDTTNDATLSWREYFTDPLLIDIIDTALRNNQELNILLNEIETSKNEIQTRKGEYLPFVHLGAAAGIEKAGRYTWDGISEEDLKANPDKGPAYIGDFMVGAFASWELDIWKKLRTAKKSAVMKYLSTVEGKNFMVTNLIAEIASSYYELLALDNLLAIVQQNIVLQTSALQIVRLEKEAAKVSQLAVNRFEAQLLNTQNLQYEIKQRIIETENRIHYLSGRFPQNIPRKSSDFTNTTLGSIHSGVPSQLLANRPDIRQAEYDLASAKLDVQVARANFYPSVRLVAGLGLNAFNPTYIVKPESILYNLAGDMIAPLVNRNAIKATYANANLKQSMLVYNYEQTILNAYIDVINQLSKIENYTSSLQTKSKEVDILMQSIDISNRLFSSARADYIEVLLTQREALESKIELIEIKLKQLEAKVGIYRALGGGWNR